MIESSNTLRDAAAQPESYESLRDGAGGAASLAWREADREENSLRTLYQQLKEDSRYTSGYKSARAWAAFNDSQEKIRARKEKAKEILRKQAASSERASIPVPDGEGTVTTDT